MALSESRPLEGNSTASLRRHAAAAQPSATPRSRQAIRRGLDQVAIRILDIIVASVTLLVMAPILLVVTLVVRATSEGPALFRQERMGRNMKTFSLYKFRTMRLDADDARHREYVQALICSEETSEQGKLYKLTVDPRITGIGHFLRSWSLDEIPQLVNVLRGEMSLVGPRPVILYEAELFPDSYLPRFSVKPGLTGLWQVSGRNRRTYQEMVALDLDYARHRSLLMDLTILLKTIPVVLGRRGVA